MDHFERCRPLRRSLKTSISTDIDFESDELHEKDFHELVSEIEDNRK